MFHLHPQQLEGTVDTTRFNQVVNIHSGYLACNTNYKVDAIHRGRSHSVLMIHGLKAEKPLVYLDGSRIVIIEGCGLRTVDLDRDYEVDGINTRSDILRAIRLDDKLLICHLSGCIAYSEDLNEELWSVSDARIQNVVLQDGMLLAFFSEHSSVRLDPETGRIMQEPLDQIDHTTFEGGNVVSFSRFASKRS